MNDPFDALETLLDHVWMRLAQGARDANDPFRIVCLATTGADGPEARMVALRRADRAGGEVEVHSDLRTAKVRALRQEPRAALLAWDAEARLQLRVAIEMRVRPADSGRWAHVPEEARLNYGTDPAPGVAVADPEHLARTPRIDRFAALVGHVRSIDAVSLAHDPHRRAVFDAQGAAGGSRPDR